jgi:hypothetical protein
MVPWRPGHTHFCLGLTRLITFLAGEKIQWGVYEEPAVSPSSSCTSYQWNPMRGVLYEESAVSPSSSWQYLKSNNFFSFSIQKDFVYFGRWNLGFKVSKVEQQAQKRGDLKRDMWLRRRNFSHMDERNYLGQGTKTFRGKWRNGRSCFQW